MATSHASGIDKDIQGQCRCFGPPTYRPTNSYKLDNLVVRSVGLESQNCQLIKWLNENEFKVKEEPLGFHEYHGRPSRDIRADENQMKRTRYYWNWHAYVLSRQPTTVMREALRIHLWFIRERYGTNDYRECGKSDIRDQLAYDIKAIEAIAQGGQCAFHGHLQEEGKSCFCVEYEIYVKGEKVKRLWDYLPFFSGMYNAAREDMSCMLHDGRACFCIWVTIEKELRTLWDFKNLYRRNTRSRPRRWSS